MFDKNFHGFASPLGDEPLKVGGAAILPQSLLVFGGICGHRRRAVIFLSERSPANRCSRRPTIRWRRGLSASTLRRMVEISFAVSAAIGAIGGILATPITLTSYRPARCWR